MLNLDELIEIFVTIIILLIGASVFIQIQFGTDITPIINSIIELAIPIFLAIFVGVVLLNLFEDL